MTTRWRSCRKKAYLLSMTRLLLKTFPIAASTPEAGPIYRSSIVAVVYNKGIIKPNDVPKSLEDLLKPQFREKVVMPDPTQDTTTMRWLASLHKIMGKERATKYIPELAATKPIFTEALISRRRALECWGSGHSYHKPQQSSHVCTERCSYGLCEARNNVGF